MSQELCTFLECSRYLPAGKWRADEPSPSGELTYNTSSDETELYQGTGCVLSLDRLQAEQEMVALQANLG